MPAWLQAFVSRNPVTHLASASRKLMHGEPALVEVTWVMVASAAIVLVASPIAMRLYRKER
jgi:ABC-2 type transport system permease protein